MEIRKIILIHKIFCHFYFSPTKSLKYFAHSQGDSEPLFENHYSQFCVSFSFAETRASVLPVLV